MPVIPNLTFQPYVDPYVGLPVDEYRNLSRTLTKNYDENENANLANELAFSQMKTIQGDDTGRSGVRKYLDDKIDSIAKDYQSGKIRWETAQGAVKAATREMYTNPDLQAEMQSYQKAQEQEKLNAQLRAEGKLVQFTTPVGHRTVTTDDKGNTVYNIYTPDSQREFDHFKEQMTYFSAIAPDGFDKVVKDVSMEAIMNDMRNGVAVSGDRLRRAWTGISDSKIKKNADRVFNEYMQSAQGQQRLKQFMGQDLAHLDYKKKKGDYNDAVDALKEEFLRTGLTRTFGQYKDYAEESLTLRSALAGKPNVDSPYGVGILMEGYNEGVKSNNITDYNKEVQGSYQSLRNIITPYVRNYSGVPADQKDIEGFIGGATTNLLSNPKLLDDMLAKNGIAPGSPQYRMAKTNFANAMTDYVNKLNVSKQAVNKGEKAIAEYRKEFGDDVVNRILTAKKGLLDNDLDNIAEEVFGKEINQDVNIRNKKLGEIKAVRSAYDDAVSDYVKNHTGIKNIKGFDSLGTNEDEKKDSKEKLKYLEDSKGNYGNYTGYAVNENGDNRTLNANNPVNLQQLVNAAGKNAKVSALYVPIPVIPNPKVGKSPGIAFTVTSPSGRTKQLYVPVGNIDVESIKKLLGTSYIQEKGWDIEAELSGLDTYYRFTPSGDILEYNVSGNDRNINSRQEVTPQQLQELLGQ